MHILILTSEFGQYFRGGLGTHVNQLVNGLADAGFRVTVGLATHDCVGVVEVHAGKSQWLSSQVPAVSNLNWHDGQMCANSELVQALRQSYPGLPFDLVHSHEWISFPVGQEIAAVAGTPHIATVHVLQDLIRRTGYTPDPRAYALEEALITGCDHVVTVSHAMRAMMLRRGDLDPERISVIYNWVDPSAFGSASPDAIQVLRRRLAPDGEQLVLYAGRLSIQKGVERLLTSSDYVRQTVPNTRWVVVGRMNPRAEESLRAFREEGNHSVVFVGEQPREVLSLFYEAADCTVVPSIYEPFGLVAIEAMAAGSSIIVSDVDGLSEIVDHNITGLRVPFQHDTTTPGPDIAALAAAQVRLLQDADLRTRLGQAARKEVQHRFARASILPEIVALYQRSF